MKIQRKILNIGGSKAITLPKDIANKLANGDSVVFDIKVVEVFGGDRKYKCTACNCEFENNPNFAYCPNCEGIDLEVLE